MNTTNTKRFCYQLLLFVFYLNTITLYAQVNEADDFYKKALTDSKSGNYDKAILLYNESIKSRLCSDLIPVNDLKSIKEKAIYLEDEMINKVAKSYRNIGLCHNRKLHFQKARQFLQFSISIYQLTGPSKSKTKDLGNAHQNLGFVYDKIGEKNLAVKSVEKALQMHLQRQKNTREVISALNALAIYNRKNGDHQKGIQICMKGDSLYHSLSKKNQLKYEEKMARIYHSWGFILHKQNKYQQAVDLYNKAIDYKISDPEITINNIAFSLIQLNRFKEAEQLLGSSIDKKRKKYKTEYNYKYSITIENFAGLETAKGNPNKALDYLQEALIHLTNNFRDKSTTKNPKVDGNHYIYNKPELLRVLDLKAQAALKSGKLDLAFQTYKDLDLWINELYKDLSSNDSKLAWIDQAHETYGNAIETALLKGEQETAFQFAEKAHAVLLWQSLSKQAAQRFLSPQDKEQLEELTTKIQQADSQFRDGKIKIDALRTLEKQRTTIEQQFEQKYPQYATSKYQPQSIQVKDIQSKITDQNTAFIEYYQTEEQLYIFTITTKGLTVTKKPINNLAETIAGFVSNLSKQKANNTAYQAQANQLYQQLIPELPETVNRLVIVPDREIGSLPFAALTTEQSSGKPNKDTPFLVKKYSTNYLYSAGSYLQLQQKTPDLPYCFAGIAPIEYQDTTWKPLLHADQEIEGMKSFHYFWQREILNRNKATKASFKRVIKEGYKTVLISTHALFNEQKGQIIFYDGIINQDEIDLMEINTHRLILSACETGVGIQNRGEGILSLGWNFAYKGVPSITMTHWKVNEYSTQKIMVAYHEQLNDKLPADQALQTAMLNFLNDEQLPDASLYAPYYWAASFHSGNVN